MPVPPRVRGSIGGEGRELVAGFRPEHLNVGEPQGNSEAGFSATCDVVEYLGNEELLHLRLGKEDIVAVVNAAAQVQAGSEVRLRLPLSKLHLFDPESGESLYAQAAKAAA
jgi:multiple sugar transport system ATP-binding protein